MFERFTHRARRVLVLAQEEARLLNHSVLGTEHILLGLIREGEGVAAQALESFDITLTAAREKVEETMGMSASVPEGNPPFTPRAKKVLELSLREAIQLGHAYIDTEHLLLGLVREGEGVAAQVLVSMGVDLGALGRRVIQIISDDEEAFMSLGKDPGRVRQHAIQIVRGDDKGVKKAPKGRRLRRDPVQSVKSTPMRDVGRPAVPREHRGDDNVIVVVGEGSVVVTPDVAVLQISLETRADSAGEALAQAAERAQAVLAAVEDLGVAAAAVQTTGMSLRPQMDEHDRRVVAYIASNSLTVRLDEVTAVSRVVDAISGAAGDALRLGGFQLSSSSTDAARADAGARAVDDARRQAERLAEASGVRVGRVLSIAGAGAAAPSPPRPMMAAARAASVPVEAGSVEVTARVTVSFEIMDRRPGDR